jgi:hypothetical protein
MCERKSTGSVLNLANLITFEHRFDERAGAQRSHVCNVAEHDSESSWRVSHPVLLLHSLTLANPHCLPRALVQTYEDIIKIIKSLPSVKDVKLSIKSEYWGMDWATEHAQQTHWQGVMRGAKRARSAGGRATFEEDAEDDEDAL